MRLVSKISMFILTALAASSCQDSYVIEGSTDVFGYEGSSLYLVYFEKGIANSIDSCMVNHGRFHMENALDEPRFVLLRKGRSTILPLILENGDIEIQIHPENVDVSGTTQNEKLYTFIHEKDLADRRYDDLNQRRNQILSQKPIDMAALTATRDSMRSAISDCERVILDFFNENWNEMAAQGVFTMLTWNVREGNIPPVISKLLNEAPEEFLQLPYVTEMMKRTGFVKSADK